MSEAPTDIAARIERRLSHDSRTSELGVHVAVRQHGVFLHGEVATEDNRRVIEKFARELTPQEFTLYNELTVPSGQTGRGSGGQDGAVRVAALGDVHLGLDSCGQLRARLSDIEERADVVLLAGDLTRCGTVAEAKVVAGELRDLPIPAVVVLGNHDHHEDEPQQVADTLVAAGVTVLEGTTVEFDIRGRRVGIAGAKGFGGGFEGRCATAFGEREMKDFVHHAGDTAARLRAALGALGTDVRVALTHYSPVPETLEGEPLELYPFLGSYLLAEAIDETAVDLAVHGHAHLGSEKGVTPGGVRVRNVAQPVIGTPYAVYEL